MLSKELNREIGRLRAKGKTLNESARSLGISQNTVVRAESKTRRVLILSDTHCGHRAGLTPPQWQYKSCNDEQIKWYNQQAQCWDWYEKTVESLKPIDVLFFLGDAIDGKGEKSGGVELIESDRNKQVKMAYECLSLCQAKNIVLVRGTPYHTGATECYEDNLADMLKHDSNVKIGEHEWPQVNGITFDLKHKISKSCVPHGQMTPLLRAKLWNSLWSERQGQPNADVIIRGHVHTFAFAGDESYLALIAPALQGWGSVYGARQCESIVKFGLIWMDIPLDAEVQDIIWRAEIPSLPCHQITQGYSI